jgi:hypothetical protein
MSSAPQLLLQHSLLKDDAKRFSEYLGYRLFKKPDDRCGLETYSETVLLSVGRKIKQGCARAATAKL